MRNLSIRAKLLILALTPLLFTLSTLFLPFLFEESITSRIVVSVLIIIVHIVIVIALVVHIAGSISNALRYINNAVKSVTAGDFDVRLRRASLKNEVYILERSLSVLIKTQAAFHADLLHLAESHCSGDTAVLLDEDAYEGSYRDAAIQINTMISEYVSISHELSDRLEKLANGNLNVSVTVRPGDFASINHSFDMLKDTIFQLDKDVNEVVTAIEKGNLSHRVGDFSYQGGWRNVADGLNNTLDTILHTINKTTIALEDMANGSFSNISDNAYAGDFAAVKDTANKTFAQYSSYIKTLTLQLESLASNNLNAVIETEFAGEFGAASHAANLLLSKWGKVIASLQELSNNIAIDTTVIASNAQRIESKIAQQNTFVQELSAVLQDVTTHTHETAQSATRAVALTSNALKNAGKGKQDMETMLTAMSQMQVSSNNIAEVIQTIDSIARQTNLLALNAAVEAANAGVNGKGFMVVADEVRVLAGKSKQAAEQTAKLVEDSLMQVGNGVRAANNTAEALDKIVKDVNYINHAVAEISEISTQQHSTIEKAARSSAKIASYTNDDTDMIANTAHSSKNLEIQVAQLKQIAESFVTNGSTMPRRIGLELDNQRNATTKAEMSPIASNRSSTSSATQARANLTSLPVRTTQTRPNDAQKPLIEKPAATRNVSTTQTASTSTSTPSKASATPLSTHTTKVAMPAATPPQNSKQPNTSRSVPATQTPMRTATATATRPAAQSPANRTTPANGDRLRCSPASTAVKPATTKRPSTQAAPSTTRTAPSVESTKPPAGAQTLERQSQVQTKLLKSKAKEEIPSGSHEYNRKDFGKY